jgi:hypothetical protein
LPGAWKKVLRWLAILPGFMVGTLAGLLVTAPRSRQASAPLAAAPAPTAPDIQRLSPSELETLALGVLSTLSEKRWNASPDGPVSAAGSWNQEWADPRQVHLGMDNLRRLLPLAKKLTLESLGDSLKSKRLSREKRLLASVRRIVLDPSLNNSAGVWEEDLTIIHVGPAYATYLTSDDEAMLLLGHELTHVAARTGGLNKFIAGMSDAARQSADMELNEDQREELACDFTGAEVLKRYISLHPTDQTAAERFSLALGYESPANRLARAWRDFCVSYNGGPDDREHLSPDQTFSILPGLDPDLKALILDDAVSTRLCR